MARYVFVGDQRDRSSNPTSVSFGGLEFPMNTAVDVDDPAVIRKLAGNSHFKRADEATREEKSGTTQSQAADFDAMDKAEMVAFAQRNGFKLDERLGVDKYREALKKADADAR